MNEQYNEHCPKCGSLPVKDIQSNYGITRTLTCGKSKCGYIWHLTWTYEKGGSIWDKVRKQEVGRYSEIMQTNAIR